MCPPELLSINLSGKHFVVTGANSGIGAATVAQLAKQGAHVTLACRRPSEGEKARASILASGATAGTVDVAELDLASLGSVKRFATRLIDSGKPLHGLVNNAGVMNTPKGKTHDGFEMQFGVNHLGHFLLTELLIPALRANQPSRIVNVSSCYHDKAQGREGRIDFDDIHFERRRYDGWAAYAQSKLANVLHARSLAKRLAGSGVTPVSVHPGWVRTNLIRSTIPPWVQNHLLSPILKLGGMIEPWEGTQSTLFALLSPEVPAHAGAFFSQTGFYRNREANRGGWPLVSPNPHAHDDAAADRLHAVSLTMVGLAEA